MLPPLAVASRCITDIILIAPTQQSLAHVHQSTIGGTGPDKQASVSPGERAMSVVRTATDDRISAWLPVGLRAVAVLALVPAGLMKFIDYGPQTARFVELGVPAADVMVVVVGLVELVAALGLAFGVASRSAAFVSVQVMLAAIFFVGVVPSNAIVLLTCLGIMVLGPGHYAVWDGEVDWLGGPW